ncbi:MAG: phage minor head protein [Desulfuromonadales bacterium]|nr:phage minor head protein [Desulfuromonadales bacterium]
MTVTALDLPFAEAIAYFRQKVNIPTERWDDLRTGMHTRGFMIAGAQRDSLLADFRTAIDKAIAEGGTLESFRKDFDRIVTTHGWSYNGSRGWRSRVIYETNLRTAHQAGRYAQMTDPDVLSYRPYWRYRHGDSRHPRPQHLAWDGLVLAADAPWWQTHYPPNDWGCKCFVEALSGRQLRKLGKDEPDDAPDSPINPTTGTPEGIGKGWDYNVGEAAWGRNEAARLMEDQGPWQDLHPWGPERFGRPEKLTPVPAAARLGRIVPKGDEAALRQSLRDAIGGEAADMADPTGTPVRVTQALVDHILAEPDERWDGREAYFPLIRDLIEDPQEIWVNFARSELSGRVALRRKYVKAVRLSSNKVLGLYAEIENGHWVSGNMFRGGLTGASNLRKGRLVYGKD